MSDQMKTSINQFMNETSIKINPGIGRKTIRHEIIFPKKFNFN